MFNKLFQNITRRQKQIGIGVVIALMTITGVALYMRNPEMFNPSRQLGAMLRINDERKPLTSGNEDTVITGSDLTIITTASTICTPQCQVGFVCKHNICVCTADIWCPTGNCKDGKCIPKDAECGFSGGNQCETDETCNNYKCAPKPGCPTACAPNEMCNANDHICVRLKCDSSNPCPPYSKCESGKCGKITERCGDGKWQQEYEQCDDGNTNNSDGCLNSCKRPQCGDGFTYFGIEDCDNGSNNSDTTPNVCRKNCRFPSCGDKVTDTKIGEECDDGNKIDGDSCNTNCIKPIPVAVACGNNNKESPEQCDDGNKITESCTYGLPSCTVCDASCNNAAGAVSFCGDGAKNGNEQCDKKTDTVNCNSDCTLKTPTAPPVPTCGNNKMEGTEECDGADTPAGYACSTNCKKILIILPSSDIDISANRTCGDKQKLSTEACDSDTVPCTSANGYAGTMTCNSNCTAYSACQTTQFCGDGAKNGNELCDLKKAIQGDGCSDTCTVETGWTCVNNVCQKALPTEPATPISSIPNVAVIEIPANDPLRDKNGILNMDTVIKKFYQAYPDNYDVLMTIEPGAHNGKSNGWEKGVIRKYAPSNIGFIDECASSINPTCTGYPTRLRYMAQYNLSLKKYLPDSVIIDLQKNAFIHELGHYWSVGWGTYNKPQCYDSWAQYVYNFPEGHWSPNFEAGEASIMLQGALLVDKNNKLLDPNMGKLTDNKDGTFTSTDTKITSPRFNFMDLYAMGLIAEKDLTNKEIFAIYDLQNKSNDLSGPGNSYYGTRKNIYISDFKKMLTDKETCEKKDYYTGDGSRVLNAYDKGNELAKDFRVANVIIKYPEQTISNKQSRLICQQVNYDLPKAWNEATYGLSKIQTQLSDATKNPDCNALFPTSKD